MNRMRKSVEINEAFKTGSWPVCTPAEGLVASK